MRSNSGTTVGAFTGQTLQAIQNALNGLGAGIFTTGNIYVCDAINGSDVSGDGSFGAPFASLQQAYNQCVSGNNDVVLLVGNGSTTGTQRLVASFTWAKNATHLIGITPPVLYSQRARIAPTSAVAAFSPFFTVSASGCLFQNVQIYAGFTVGMVAALAVVVSGNRNFFKSCHLVGMSDAASAADAGSRSLKIDGGQENVFLDCVIGDDTIARSAANASIEFATKGGSAATRNVFRSCIVPLFTSAATPLGILGTGAACVDRDNLFEQCSFLNQIKSTSTQMTVLGSFTSAAPGGMVVFKGCAMVGVTKFGDTNFLANSFIDMPAVSAAAGGLMVAPS